MNRLAPLLLRVALVDRCSCEGSFFGPVLAAVKASADSNDARLELRRHHKEYRKIEVRSRTSQRGTAVMMRTACRFRLLRPIFSLGTA